MKIKILLLGTYLFGTSSFFAQNTTERLEFDVRGDYVKHVAFPLNDHGMLLQSTAAKGSKGNLEVKNEFYDTNFNLIATETVFVKDRTEIIGSYQQENINYSLIRNKRDYVGIVISDMQNKTVKKVESKYTNEGTLTGMKVYGNKAIFKSVYRKENKIIIIDLVSGESNEVLFKFDNFRKNDIQIEDFQVLDNELIVFVNVKNSRKSVDLYLAHLDLNGSQKEFYRITDNIDEKLVEVSATKVGDKYIITGTYSKTRLDMSQGIFFGEVVNKNLNYINFYNFIDLKNFTAYMTDRQKRKIERASENAENNNKELLLNYNIENHEIKVTDDGYILLGEAYYPTYITISTGNGGSNSIFDGYFYTHAFISKFDKKGNLIWDNSFEINPGYKPMEVKRFISMKNSNSDIDLSFGNLEEIVYKKIDANNGSTIIDDSVEVIDTQLSGDKIRRSFSEVNYWYDNNFIAYGTQTVTNTDVKRPRRIFFVNKITYNKN